MSDNRKYTVGKDADGFTTLNGKRVYWPDHRDPDGYATFRLPGEPPHLDSATMRARTAEYYRQIRGRYDPSRLIGLAHLRKIRESLIDS